MKQDRISTRQLGALLWAGLMAPAAELLPAVTLPLAGRAAWLSALAALPVVLLIGWTLTKLDLSRDGLAGAVCRGMGPWAGKGVLLLYMIWGELLLALRLRLCAQRLLTAGERDGSLWFFCLRRRRWFCGWPGGSCRPLPGRDSFFWRCC